MTGPKPANLRPRLEAIATFEDPRVQALARFALAVLEEEEFSAETDDVGAALMPSRLRRVLAALERELGEVSGG